jgi:hypothetical protein
LPATVAIGAGWTSIRLDVTLVLGSGAETMGGIVAGGGGGVNKTGGGAALSSGEGERRETENPDTDGRDCVVRGTGGGGVVRERGGGGWVFGIECAWEGLADMGSGGGRLGGGAGAGVAAAELGGASLARTGSTTGVGVASISSRSPLSSSSELASAAVAVALASPSSLSGLLAISSSCAPVMVFLLAKDKPIGPLGFTRRAVLSTNSDLQKSSDSPPRPRQSRTDCSQPLGYSLVTRREGVKSRRRSCPAGRKSERKALLRVTPPRRLRSRWRQRPPGRRPVRLGPRRPSRSPCTGRVSRSTTGPRQRG